jgi:plastocyanin
MTLIYVSRKWIYASLIGFTLIICGWLLFDEESVPTTVEGNDKYVINMVTGEFKSETEDGKEIEAYRWDPGTIYVPKGKNITLSIYGVNGKEHPFIIEGTDIKGTVKKGEETLIPLRFDEEGTYRLICLTHQDISHNGPMIAYIVVD